MPHIHAALTRRTNGRSLETFQTKNDLPEIRGHLRERYFPLFFFSVLQRVGKVGTKAAQL
jgi:hypothetical protein